MTPEYIPTTSALQCPREFYNLISVKNCENCRFFLNYSLSAKTKSLSDLGSSENKDKDLEIICNYIEEKESFFDEIKEYFSTWGYASIETYSTEESLNLIGKNEYGYNSIIVRILFKEVAGVTDVRNFIHDLEGDNYENMLLFVLEKFTHYAKKEAEAAGISVQMDTLEKPYNLPNEKYGDDFENSGEDEEYSNDSNDGW